MVGGGLPGGEAQGHDEVVVLGLVAGGFKVQELALQDLQAWGTALQLELPPLKQELQTGQQIATGDAQVRTVFDGQ